MIPQIHIAGAKRSGKTTLGRSLVKALQAKQIGSTLVDVDEVRTEIFGKFAGVPDSPESMKEHLATISAMHKSILPRILEVGGSPVAVAGYSREGQYDAMVALSEKFGTRLIILVVNPPTLKEAAERAKHMTADDRSDMKDFSDQNIQNSFRASAERVNTLYRSLHDIRIHWIDQGSKDEMLERALKYLWRG